MWNCCAPLQTECRCTGYVPAGKPENETATVAGTACGGAAASGVGLGLGLGVGLGLGDGEGEGEGDIVGDCAALGERGGAAAVVPPGVEHAPANIRIATRPVSPVLKSTAR
jgi:hypothetical protein